jgi:hypothetical protein
LRIFSEGDTMDLLDILHPDNWDWLEDEEEEKNKVRKKKVQKVRAASVKPQRWDEADGF